MADIELLYDTIRKADAAGDTASVRRLLEYLEEINKPQTTTFGYAKEALRAIPRGLVRGLETAATGAAALLPTEVEKPVVARAQELAERLAPQAAPGYEESIPVKLGEGLGSMGTFLIPGGLPARALMAGSMGAGEARQRAQQAGVTPEEISSATAQGIIPGLLDLLPVEMLLGKFGTRAVKGLMDRAVNMAATGGVEGAQEAAQEILQNAIAQGYDPSQGLYEGVEESATYGAAVGAIAQGLLDLALPGRARRVARVEPADRGVAPAVVPEPVVTPEPAVATEPVVTPEPVVATEPIVKEPTPEPQLAAQAPQAQPVEAPAKTIAAEVKKPVKIEKPVTAEDYQYEIARLKEELPNAKSAGHRSFIANKIARYEAALAAAPGVAPPVDAKTLLKQRKVPTDEYAASVDNVGPKGRRASIEQPVPSGVTPEPGVAAVDVAGMGGVEPTVGGTAGGKEVQQGPLTVESFVADRIAGKKQDSPEEIQFYQNNAKEIENALKKAVEVKPVTEAKTEAPVTEAKTKTEAPEVIPAERQKRIAEYEQMKGAPQAAKDYYLHYGSINESLKNLGFDLAYKTKKGEMGYVKEGGAPAKQFADWIKKVGTSEQKISLEKSQKEYAKLKEKTEDEIFVKEGVKQRDLEQAVREQLEKERRQAAEAEFKTRQREAITEVETEEEARAAEAATKAKEQAAEYARAHRASQGPATAPTGNTPDDVTKALKNYFKEDSRFDELTTVVQTEAQLPEEVRKSKDYRAGTRGVAYKGKVWLVADNIEPGRELGVFLHEAGAHIGFDDVLKPSDRQFLADQVRKWAKGGPDLVETKAAKAALERGGQSNDEIIAYMTEELVNRGVKPTSFRPASTWLRRVVAAFKKALKKIGLMKDITPQELVDAVNGAAHIAMKAPGKAVEVAPRFSTGNPTLDAAMYRRGEILTREGDKPLSTKIANFFGGDKKQAFMKFRVNVEDNEASVKAKLKDAGDMEPLIHMAFASKAADTAVTSMLHGALQIDPKTGAFHAVEGDSIKTVHGHILSIAKKLDAKNPEEAFKSASHIFDLGGNVLRERGLPAELQGRFKFTPEDVLAGEEALRLYGKEIRAAMDAWTRYKNGMLDAGLKAGRFSKEDVDAWKEASDYVPWHRILDNAKFGYETASSAREFFSNLKPSGKIRELVGGDVERRPIGSLLNNMEQLSFWLGTTTIKNHTANKVVDSLLNLDARKVGSPNAYDVDRARVVRTYRDGVAAYYELGSPLDAYAFMGVENDTSDFTKMMAKGANWLRRGTTLMPGFVASQVFQDAFRATLYSGAKSPFSVGAKTFSEFARELKGDALTQHLASYGIVGRPDNILGAEKGRIRGALDDTSTGVKRATISAFRALDKLTHASDAAQRRAIYKQTLQEGGSESMALYKAIEIINFQTRGANQTISTLRHIIPFMNAYIQSMSVTLRSLAGHGITLEERNQAMRTFYATAVKIGALSLLYSMLVSDDKEYQDAPDHEKMTGFIIPGTRQMIKDMTGTDPGGNLKIPAPTDLTGLLFKTIPESTYNYVVRLGTKNEIDNTKFLRGMSSAAVQAISPPSAVPQAVKPVLELWTNYDFFTGSPVVGRGLQHLEKSQQFTSSTSEFAKVLGDYLPMAPVQIDHLVRGMFGTAGGTMMFAASQVIDSVTPGERPSARLNEIPQVKTFLTGKATSGMKEDFYELRDKLMTVNTTVNRLKIRDPEYLKQYIDENKELYALQKSGIVTKIDKQLSELRAYRDRIDSDKKMSAEEKRKVFDRIEEMEVRYLTMVNPSALRRISGL